MDIEDPKLQLHYADLILTTIQTIMKKYLTEEQLQLKSLEALKVYLAYDIFE